MLIPCPYCGLRPESEFTIRGDAAPRRPALLAEPASLDADATAAMAHYVYARENPAGLVNEYWYHGAGCRSWLVVHRDTVTHEIKGATLAERWQR